MVISSTRYRFLQSLRMTLQCLIFPTLFKLLTTYFSTAKFEFSFNDFTDLFDFGLLIFCYLWYCNARRIFDDD